jgi:hypothetical protein
MNKMYKIITTILLLAPAMHAGAQCEFVIPQQTVPVGNMPDTTITTAEGLFWVCSGTEASFFGNNNMILGEAESQLHIFGDNNTVITRGAVMLHGMNNNVYVGNADHVDDQGTNSDVAICSEINLIADPGPEGGCLTTGISEISTGNVTVHPNPVIGELHITSTTDRPIRQVWVKDVLGREVMHEMGAVETIQMESLPTGSYIVIVEAGTDKTVHQVRKDR